jgi:hypothetical protein
VIRRWLCAYRDPVVALRLPPANGCDPFGIEEGGGRFIRPAVTRTGGGAALKKRGDSPWVFGNPVSQPAQASWAI